MARNKQHRKVDAKKGKVPQEVVKDKSTLKSVAHDHGCWYQCVQDLPPGEIIDIPYLKKLNIRDMVPVAYCKYPDIDKVETLFLIIS